MHHWRIQFIDVFQHAAQFESDTGCPIRIHSRLHRLTEIVALNIFHFNDEIAIEGLYSINRDDARLFRGNGLLHLRAIFFQLDSLLIVKSLFFLSGIVTLFNPKFMAAMNGMMAQIAAKNPGFPAGQAIFPPRFLEALFAFSSIFGIALIVVMAIYRSRFLKAAAEAAQ